MLGSTFICEPSAGKLVVLGRDIDQIDEFVHVNMDVLLTLDFESICASSNLKWVAGDPVVLDEEGGLAIFPVSEGALEYVLTQGGTLEEEQAADLSRLEAFLRVNGKKNIFEMATY